MRNILSDFAWVLDLKMVKMIIIKLLHTFLQSWAHKWCKNLWKVLQNSMLQNISAYWPSRKKLHRMLVSGLTWDFNKFGHHRLRHCWYSYHRYWCSVILAPYSRGSPWKCSKRKERLYPFQKAVEDHRGHFTPFVVSVDGLLHREAHHFIRHIAASLSIKGEKSYSETVAFVRTWLSFAILRSASLCLRGSSEMAMCSRVWCCLGLPSH